MSLVFSLGLLAFGSDVWLEGWCWSRSR